jgi:hypothetical protein
MNPEAFADGVTTACLLSAVFVAFYILFACDFAFVF